MRRAVGERDACARCGQDIEWHGKHRWLDRGGNRACVVYYDKERGAYVRPRADAKHKPASPATPATPATRPEPKKDAATLSIRIWTEPGGTLPDDLEEAFQPHCEHVARMCSEGCTSGEICDESFSGWWDITKDSSK